MSNQNNGGKFGTGAVFGALIGAALGLLYAPKSGEETRKKLKVEAEKIKQKPEVQKALKEVEKFKQKPEVKRAINEVNKLRKAVKSKVKTKTKPPVKKTTK